VQVTRVQSAPDGEALASAIELLDLVVLIDLYAMKVREMPTTSCPRPRSSKRSDGP
jgi:hypothetical protein